MKAPIIFLLLKEEVKKKYVYRTQKLFILELARELIGTFSARKSLGRPLTQTSLPGRYTERHMPTKFSNLVRCKQCHRTDKLKERSMDTLNVVFIYVPCLALETITQRIR